MPLGTCAVTVQWTCGCLCSPDRLSCAPPPHDGWPEGLSTALEAGLAGGCGLLEKQGPSNAGNNVFV